MSHAISLPSFTVPVSTAPRDQVQFEIDVPIGRPGRQQKNLVARFLHEHPLQGHRAGAEMIEVGAGVRAFAAVQRKAAHRRGDAEAAHQSVGGLGGVAGAGPVDLVLRPAGAAEGVLARSDASSSTSTSSPVPSARPKQRNGKTG